MSRSPHALYRAASRRLMEAACRLAPPDVRAEVAERVSDAMVSRVEIPGGSLAFYAPTRLLQIRAEHTLDKEPDLIAWLDTLGPDDVLWDIGANVGVFALYAAARTRCRVLAFEPSGPNYYVLARNVELNRLGGRISAYCVALCGETTLGTLNLTTLGLGLALSQFGRRGDHSRYGGGAQGDCGHAMLGFTVDEFIARFQPPFPTHIKMDVDGLEGPILEGARATLADPRLRGATIELSLSRADERNAALSLLATSGLSLVSQGPPQGDERESAANHRFARNAAR